MASDKLYQSAFQYKKAKLWEKITDTNIFAVKLSDGNIGYICIMGMAGRHCALALYVGEVGVDSYITLLNAQKEDVLNALTPLQLQEHFMRQNCLQCALVDLSELSQEENKEVQAYAKMHKIRQNKNSVYPQFKKYQPRHIPWHLQSESEEIYLCEALTAAVAMAEILEKKSVSEVGFEDIRNDVTRIPMLELVNGKYILKKIQVPKPLAVVYPTPRAANDISVAKLRKAKKRGVWECELVQYPAPVQSEGDEAPVFPMGIFAIDSVTGYLLSVPPVMDFDDTPDKLLELFMEAFLKEKLCPKMLKVRDERTRCFVEALCEKLNISLKVDKKLPLLDDAEEDFVEHFAPGHQQLEDALGLLNEILDFSDEDLADLPDELVEQLKALMDQGMMSDRIAGDVSRILEFTKAGHKESGKDGKKTVQKQETSNIVSIVPANQAAEPKQQPGKSYIISVTYEPGCYRHIQISEDSTLFDLHKAILKAFSFEDNRAHVFFMDNVVWSDQDAYYAGGIEDANKKTNKCTIRKLKLEIGAKFKYLFDFGEEWLFQCKVLRIVDGLTDEPSVIKSKGEAPGQYDNW